MSAALNLARESFMMVDPVWMQPSLQPCAWVLCIHICQVLVGMWLTYCWYAQYNVCIDASDHKFIPFLFSFSRGGVMLVHDIHKNKTRVINFQGTAPKTLKEEMLQNVSELKVIKRWGEGCHSLLLIMFFRFIILLHPFRQVCTWECQVCSEVYTRLTACMGGNKL